MPIPRISNNAANIYGASLRYEQNGKTQNPINPNLLPEPIDFLTGWSATGSAVILSSNEVNVPTGVAGGLRCIQDVEPGASYIMTIVVEQDAPTAAANELTITVNATAPLASYKVHDQELSQGSNSFTFIMHKGSYLVAGNSIVMDWGSGTDDVALTFKKMELKKCPTTRIITAGVGTDTFQGSSEGTTVWKMIAFQDRDGFSPTIAALTANNIMPADCAKLIGQPFAVGTEIMGDFTEILVAKGYWKIYMRLPKN